MTSKRFGLLLLAAVLVTGAGSVAGGPDKQPGLDEYAALDRLTAASLPVVLRFNKITLAGVLDGMERVSGVDIDFEALPEAHVSIDTSGEVTLKEALIRLARAHNLVYEVIGNDKLVVRADAGAASIPTPDEYAALDQLTAASNPVQLSSNQVYLGTILEAMGRAAGVHIDYTASRETYVSIDTGGMVTLKEALVRLARENNLVYEVCGTDELVVRSKGKTLG